jgi:hypothetical protein
VKPFAVAIGDVAVGTTESARSTTIEVAADKTALEVPTALVPMTDTLMKEPMSLSVNTYWLVVAELIFEYVPLTVLAFIH